MTIVNDPENRKTIDTDTGLYLTRENERPQEHYSFFRLLGAPKEVGVEVISRILKKSASEWEIVYYRFRLVTDGGFQDAQEYLRYRNMVDKLIMVFKFSYGDPRDDRFQDSWKMSCRVDHSQDKKAIIGGESVSI